MSVREYIGARYVPLFADPLTWDATKTYEPLTVVLYQGNSYTSRQAVPANIEITNTTFWAQTGNYNAQVEQYRAEVQTFDGRITQNATDITAEETARQNADTLLDGKITSEVGAEATLRENADTALGTRITNEETARANADTALGTSITNEETARANADTNLQTAISNEVTARQAADTTLQTEIAEKGNSDIVTITNTTNLFINAVSGDDENDGSDDDNAVQTLARAVEIARQRNMHNVSFRIRANGIYTFPGNEIANAAMHITCGQNANNVTLEFENNMLWAYNSYIHMATYDNYLLTVNTPSGFHCDKCGMYAENVNFVVGTRFDFNCSSQVTFLKCKLTLSVIMQINSNSFLEFLSGNTIQLSSGNSQFIYARGATLRILDTITYIMSGTPTGSIMRVDEGTIYLLATFTNGGSVSTSGGAIILARAFMITSGTALNSFAAVSTNATRVGGTNSMYLQAGQLNYIP